MSSPPRPVGRRADREECPAEWEERTSNRSLPSSFFPIARHKGKSVIFLLNSSTAMERKLLMKGKVKEAYDLGDRLEFQFTDNISVFDKIIPSTIPFKGETLCREGLLV